MGDFVLQFLAVGILLAVIDAIWLSVVAKKFYKSQLGPLMLDKPNMVPAVIFYLIYIVGVVVFVLQPALMAGSWAHALGYGALFGLVAYATYDLTNLATIKGFTAKLVAVDLVWGSAMTATVSVLAYVVLHR